MTDTDGTAPAPNIVLADDGELDDVRSVLDELGAEYAVWGKAADPGREVGPTQLLVASLGRVRQLGLRRTGRRDPERPVWIAVADAAAPVARESLLRHGFDYLVRRPVHGAALRLLLTRALFRGADRRHGTRVAVGYAARLRANLWPHAVTLVDLSPRGCLLLSRTQVRKGKRASLIVPPDLTGDKALTLKGTIVRARRGDLVGGDRGETALAMRFDKVNRTTKERLRALLVELSTGPSTLIEETIDPVEPETRPDRPARQPRGVFEEPVLVFGDRELGLIGSDLSSGGMRVRPEACVAIGDRLRLAIEAGPRQEPIVVVARVARDDAERGYGLVFEDVEAGGRECLQQVVAALPAVESLEPDAAEGGPIAVTRLIPGLLRVRTRS